MPHSASEPFVGDTGVTATKDFDDRPRQWREQLVHSFGVPEVVENGAVEVLRNSHHRGVRWSTERLRPRPAAMSDGLEERFLDCVLRDQRDAQGLRQWLGETGLSRSGQSAYDDEQGACRHASHSALRQDRRLGIAAFRRVRSRALPGGSLTAMKTAVSKSR
jgi:hypothetical protein